MAFFDKVYGAGLVNGYIKVAGGTSYDIEAIVTVEGSPAQDDTEVKGDDTIKATFSSNRKEEITITANGLTLDNIVAITGNAISSSATGAEIALGTAGELNPPFVEIGAETNGRASDGTASVIKKVWHKVQLGNIKVSMAGESEFSIEMSGNALQTATSITGSALSSTRVATLSVRSGVAS